MSSSAPGISPTAPTISDTPPPVSSEVEIAPQATPISTRRAIQLGSALGIGIVALLILGIMPRVALQRQLGAQAASASVLLPVIAVSTAQRPATASTLMLPGTMEALHEAALYARVSGYVRRWYADIGTSVRAGQVLVDIDVPELQQAVLQGRAQLAQMQSTLVLARSNLARWRALAADSAVTMQEFQQMQQAYDASAANVRAAEANLKGLVSTLQYAQVRAPFSGVVVARNVDNGALISAGGASSTPLTAGGSQFAASTSVAAASLFRIAQTDTMRVYVSIPQPYVASIRQGLPAELVVANQGGRSFRGTVVRIAGAVDASTRTLLAEVDVPNPGHVLLPGMYAQLRLTVQRVDAPLVVPSTALVVRGAVPQVMELTPSGSGNASVHFRDVQIARDYGNTIEIVSGLADGALVASIGSQILTEGQTVRIVTAPADSAGAKAVAITKGGI